MTWEYKSCKNCGDQFKPRGPKQFCKRICKVLYHTKNHIEKHKELVKEIKLARGCESGFCQWQGEFEPEMLDFDHIDPSTKTGNVACILTRKTENLLEEISKCRIICANCHRTYTKRNWNAYQPKEDEKS